MSKPLELSKAHLPESGGGGGGGGLERNCICCSGTKAGVSKSPGSLQLPRQPHPPRRGRSPSHSLIGLQLPFCQRQTPAGAACKWTAVVAPVEEEEEEEEEVADREGEMKEKERDNREAEVEDKIDDRKEVMKEEESKQSAERGGGQSEPLEERAEGEWRGG